MSLHFSEDDLVSNTSSSDWTIIATESSFDVVEGPERSTTIQNLNTGNGASNGSKMNATSIATKKDWRGPLNLVEIGKLATFGQHEKIVNSIGGVLGTKINEFTPVWIAEGREPTSQEYSKQEKMMARKAEINAKFMEAAMDFDLFIKSTALNPNFTEEQAKALWHRFSENVKNTKIIDDAICKTVHDAIVAQRYKSPYPLRYQSNH